MKIWSKNIITGGSILMASMMAANVINLVFNVYLGRKIDLGNYSTVAIINTMWYFISIFIAALSSTLVHRVAYLSTKYNVDAATFFFKTTRNRALAVVAVITGLYILISPALQVFFHLSSSAVLILIAPSLIAGMLLSLNSSYLTANLLFKYVAILNFIEPVVKFGVAIVIVNAGFEEFAFLAIPISVLAASVISFFFIKSEVAKTVSKHLYRFPKRFYFAALLSGLASNAFLVYDISLVKHYLTPELAGEYALLALVGKIIFFMGSLVNTFMLVLVTKDIAAKKDPNKTFYKLMGGIVFLVVGSAVCLGFFGGPFVTALFGANALSIIPYLQLYSFTIAAFTIANAIVGYHLAQKHYVFPVGAILLSLVMVFGIFLHHANIIQIVQVMAIVASINLLTMLGLHILQKEGGFFILNFLDLIALVLPLPKTAPLPAGKRILIFNWRDMLHANAGGAEVYVHELAKRWVQKGNTVTLFCGNDGHSPRDEEIDGVSIVRRGGFYMVYFWAFIYYMLRFRGQYDIILDCENGLPFFIPFYAREKIFLVIHHVHQNVFRKSLNPILSAVASFLELKVMPVVYENIKVITVSPSSKKDIMKFELTLKEPEIVYNGVDLQKFKPGPKSFNPLIVYMGRLKQYKTIDVLIHATKIVLESMPEAELIIAGDGEEKEKLMKLVAHLHLKEKVQFLGKISENQKIKLLQSAWVAVNPSSMEGWGITVIEANACGTPVVASRVPGLIDSVRNPRTGYLVEYGNAEKFAEKILHLLQDTEKRDKISQQAVEWSQKFNWDKSADKSLKILLA